MKRIYKSANNTKLLAYRASLTPIQRESEESGTPSMGRRTSRVRSKIKQQDSYLLGGRAGSFPVSEHLGRTRARGLNSMIHFLYITKSQ